jgi:hypothetical protein
LLLHWGFDGFDSFAASWVVLIAVPWTCAVLTACFIAFEGYRERPAFRQATLLLLVLSFADLLLAFTFKAAN